MTLLFFAFGCTDIGEPSHDDFVNSLGTIIQDPVGTHLIKTEPVIKGEFSTFYPLNLSDNFRSAGLRIRFSARFEILPNVSYLYPPIRLTKIAAVGQ